MHETVALETLGCKVNQYESSFLLEQLAQAGYAMVSFRERADIYVVHSCTVTAKASLQTRQLLRRAGRLNPRASIAVIGCDAQLDAERLAHEGLATHILGSVEKLDLVKWLGTPGSFSKPCRALTDPRAYRGLRPLPVSRMHSGRARAFLKVQDGCNAFCSYCIVPHTRGASRSLPYEDVRAQMDLFMSRGYREVVLTGIHLGQWGRDFDPPASLASLLESLARGPMPSRVRLSSLESAEWDSQILRKLPAWPWICPHFHIPLQSGDASILERMHRPYSPLEYAEVVRELNALFPDAALGADVLVGFPGETERHFLNTYELIEALPLTYLHVFPFSPRPGAPAAEQPGRIAGVELKRRAQALQELSARKKAAFRLRFLGREVEVLAETQVKPGWWLGTSGNYLQVAFPGHAAQGRLVRVRVTGERDGGLAGEPLLFGSESA